MTRINWIEIQGFRSYGKEIQKLDFSSSIAVIWGSNSQGKTSLAEAFEFLLTGETVRKQMVASAQDEFADSLRNAHISEQTPTYVSAEIVDDSGSPHVVRRTLLQDYGRRHSCDSTLEIDGAPATEDDLHSLGVRLSEPPLSAPVLMQHTLAYLFSARPQDRSLYFKALLEVTDLDEFRKRVKEVEPTALESADLRKLDGATANVTLGPVLSSLYNGPIALAAIAELVNEAVSKLITEAGEVLPSSDSECQLRLRTLLTERQSKTFPMEFFDREDLRIWEEPSGVTWAALDRFVEQVRLVDEETRRLTSLFSEILKLPSVEDADQPIDCPVCDTEKALTPDRIEFIRNRLEQTSDYRLAEQEASKALHVFHSILDDLQGQILAACPRFLGLERSERIESGFQIFRIRELLRDNQIEIIDVWCRATWALARSRRQLSKSISKKTLDVAKLRANPTLLSDTTFLRTIFAALREAFEIFKAALEDYISASEPLLLELQTVVAERSDTKGWKDLLDLAEDPGALYEALIVRHVREKLREEYSKALREIDRAKEKVLDTKFNELSSEICFWWELLRPDESTFFSSLALRQGGRRNIDFKAGLSTTPDRSNTQVRDVIAVFSLSQLHCLGLATFFARAAYDRESFLVLDDPILSSDEDYRAHFIASALEELIRRKQQVIILTQDQGCWKNLQERYAHESIDVFQLTFDEACMGSVVTKTSDTLASMLSRARPYIRSNHPDLRKRAAGQLRDVTERFCKELLVTKKRDAGDQNAALTDYDRKNLGELIPLVEPYLTDSSHPGKLRAIAQALNPGPHDDAIPSKGSLVVSFGDLMKFRSDYL